jgi:hypothetical protein
MRTGKRFAACALITAVLVSAGCEPEHLRGRAEPSADGRTYLVIDDDNGGTCGPMFVDCGQDGSIEFEVPPGTTFHFDYWGP